MSFLAAWQELIRKRKATPQPQPYRQTYRMPTGNGQYLSVPMKAGAAGTAMLLALAGQPAGSNQNFMQTMAMGGVDSGALPQYIGQDLREDRFKNVFPNDEKQRTAFLANQRNISPEAFQMMHNNLVTGQFDSLSQRNKFAWNLKRGSASDPQFNTNISTQDGIEYTGVTRLADGGLIFHNVKYSGDNPQRYKSVVVAGDDRNRVAYFGGQVPDKDGNYSDDGELLNVFRGRVDGQTQVYQQGPNGEIGRFRGFNPEPEVVATAADAAGANVQPEAKEDGAAADDLGGTASPNAFLENFNGSTSYMGAYADAAGVIQEQQAQAGQVLDARNAEWNTADQQLANLEDPFGMNGQGTANLVPALDNVINAGQASQAAQQNYDNLSQMNETAMQAVDQTGTANGEPAMLESGAGE